MRSALRFGTLLVVACAATLRADDTKPADKPAAPPEGFTSLFDGKTLTGWKPTGKADVWSAEGGAIVCKGGGGGYLLTDKEYGNFEFRCEYRWEKKGGNSGVGLRTPEKGDPAYAGMEIQLIDDEGWPGKLADYQHTGSIYDVQPAKPAKNKPIGEWNAVKIVCDGRKVTVELFRQLLAEGWRVHATLRDPAKEAALRPMLGGTAETLRFFPVDLLSDPKVKSAYLGFD